MKQQKFYFSLVLFSLLGQVAWVVENMLFNTFLKDEIGASPFHIALMVSLSAIVATVTTLFLGAYSDKIGKRKKFIWIGYVIWGITILAFSLINKDNLLSKYQSEAKAIIVGTALTIILDCVMTFFGSVANDACFNAWITDSTNEKNRGKIEGINSMMPLLAVLLVFGLLSGFAVHGKWWILFVILGLLIVAVGIIGAFTIEETNIVVDKEIKYFKRIFYGFKISSIKENKMLYLTYLAFALFGIGIQIFMTFLIIYYDEVMPNGQYVFVMAPAIIIAAIATFFYGRLYDKYGFNKTIIPSLLVLIFGLSVLSLNLINTLDGNVFIIFIGSLFMMIGNLCSSAIFGAKMREQTPKDKVGSFQGIKMFSQVLIPMLIGPWIGAIAITGNFSYDAESFLGGFASSFKASLAIFLAFAIIILICLIFIVLVFKKENKEEINNE